MRPTEPAVEHCPACERRGLHVARPADGGPCAVCGTPWADVQVAPIQPPGPGAVAAGVVARAPRISRVDEVEPVTRVFYSQAEAVFVWGMVSCVLIVLASVAGAAFVHPMLIIYALLVIPVLASVRLVMALYKAMGKTVDLLAEVADNTRPR